MATRASKGGGSTISGVVYQLLWSLLRVAKLRVHLAKTDPEAPAFPSELIVVLEPREGGDLHLKGGHSLIVEQLKTRSDDSSWSLKQIIEEVLPDLFLATTSAASGGTSFRFVTEGRMGDWTSVYDGFFRTLSERKRSADVLASLDDNEALKFMRHRSQSEKAFFPELVTERNLFLKIAAVIAARPTIKSLGLTEAALHERVWNLLANFEFDSRHPIAEVTQEIDSILLALVDRDKDIAQVRDHLALELARLAVRGGAEIEATSFLSEHNLSSVPLSDWIGHRERAAIVLQRTLARRNYRSSYDIRRDGLSPASRGRVVVITGHSGTGKSWMLNARAEASACTPHLPILIESTGSADSDLKKISEVFWYDIHDGDDALHLSRISRRLRRVADNKADIGLHVFVDGIQNYAEAAQLVQNDWVGWNCSLSLSCIPPIADSLLSAFPDQIEVIYCSTFSWEQLHNLLDRRFGHGWPSIREDVRAVLKVPLLAGIYCDEFSDSAWLPKSEYELYEYVWRRLSGGSAVSLLNCTRIEALAYAVLEGCVYPWTGHDLLRLGVDEGALERLVSVGWLTQTGDGRIRVFHDRLLQWAIAKSICTRFKGSQISLPEVAKCITDIVQGVSVQKEVNLDFVPMDVLWILIQAGTQDREIAEILNSLEAVDDRYSEQLYKEHVPTLGERIVNAVLIRYREFKGHPWIRNRIGEALRKVAPHKIEQLAQPLIQSTDTREQRLGIKLVGDIPCPNLLDDFWKIHLAGQAAPQEFGDEAKSWQLYRETFEVLKSATRRRPQWLMDAILKSPATERCDDLAWLVANIDDRGKIWRQCKTQLFEKVSRDKQRCLLACIGKHQDKDELDYVIKSVGTRTGFGEDSLAIHTLTRLDADLAVELLPTSDLADMTMSRQWSFAQVYARRPKQTHLAIIKWMEQCENPWQVGLLFQDSVNYISPDELRLLLSSLETMMTEDLSSEQLGQRGLHREFNMLSHVAEPSLLEVLADQAGTAFEATLRDYILRIGPRRGVWMDSAVRDPAIKVMNLIGGEGLADIVNDFLESGDQYACSDAITWSGKRPNSKTIQLLKQIVLSDVQWNGGTNPHPVNQNSAMKVLAGLGYWESVAEGLTKWGMKTSPDLELPSDSIAAPWMRQLRAKVKRMPTPGNVLALGSFGDRSDCTLIYDVLDSCDPKSELAHASIIALENLGDQSDEGITRVVAHLLIEKHNYSATQMLSAAGSPSAWQALFKDLQRKFDFITALNLINLSEHADEVIDLVLEKWSTYRGSDHISMLNLFIKKIRKEVYRRRILEDPEVREFVHQLSTAAEGNFWFTGSKAAMIQTLALFHPEAAFAAACRCLEDRNLHDRDLYPSILVEIDAEKATAWLCDHCAAEQSELVRYAVGRAIQGRNLVGQIMSGLESSRSEVREASCFLAGWLTTDEEVDKSLTARLDDSSPNVVSAALAAQQMRSDRAITNQLVTRLEHETDHKRKSIWLDALIGVADPGGESEELSSTLKRALEFVKPTEADAAVSRITKRRKKLADELKKVKR